MFTLRKFFTKRVWAVILFLSLYSFVIYANVQIDFFHARAHPGYYLNSKAEIVWGKGERDILVQADPATFKILGDPVLCMGECPREYAKDKNHVFFEGEVLESADPRTFTEPSSYVDFYSMDATHVYWGSRRVPHADARNFERVSGDVGIDSEYAYFRGRAYPKKTYKASRGGLVIGGVAYSGRTPIVDADATTYEPLDHWYGRDKNSVFYEGKKVPKFDPATFHVINESFLSDKNGVYAGWTHSPSNKDGVHTHELLIPLVGKNVRTIDPVADSALFDVCNSGTMDKLCCTCARDDNDLFVLTRNSDESQLLSIPMSEVKIIKEQRKSGPHSSLHYNGFVYSTGFEFKNKE